MTSFTSQQTPMAMPGAGSVRFVGLDVHSAFTSVHAQDAQGGSRGSVRRVPTSREGFAELKVALGLDTEVLVGFEAGPQANFVVTILRGLGLQPRPICPREARLLARRRRQKCDSSDAFELCDGLRRGIYRRTPWIPTAPIEELRATVRARATAVEGRTAATNRLEALLRRLGEAAQATEPLGSCKGWERALAVIPAGPSRKVAELDFDAWKTADKSVRTLSKEILRQLQTYFPLESDLLATIPQVGTVVSAAILAAIGDVSRFPDSGRFVSYLGLTPSMHDSGGQQRRGAITREGCPYTRNLLIEAAQKAARKDHPLHAGFQRIAHRKGHRRALIAIAARLARIAFHVLKTGRPFDPVRHSARTWS